MDKKKIMLSSFIRLRVHSRCNISISFVVAIFKEKFSIKKILVPENFIVWKFPGPYEPCVIIHEKIQYKMYLKNKLFILYKIRFIKYTLRIDRFSSNHFLLLAFTLFQTVTKILYILTQDNRLTFKRADVSL